MKKVSSSLVYTNLGFRYIAELVIIQIYHRRGDLFLSWTTKTENSFMEKKKQTVTVFHRQIQAIMSNEWNRRRFSRRILQCCFLHLITFKIFSGNCPNSYHYLLALRLTYSNLPIFWSKFCAFGRYLLN